MSATCQRQLDLSPYARVLSEKHHWSKQRIAAACEGYREFFASAAVTPKQNPSMDVDEVWHLHILHTQQYTADCEEMLGFYYHHIPSFMSEAQCSGGACSGD